MRTILVVEDDFEIQQIISIYIHEKTNYKVVIADDGEVAIDLIQENMPDLILLDMMLPRIGGMALLQNIKKNKKIKNIPVIFMSGVLIDETFRKEGIDLGAVDYLKKPIDLEAMLEKIMRILGDI
ncbi:response regulator [candidate division KSB1 bacterium]